MNAKSYVLVFLSLLLALSTGCKKKEPPVSAAEVRAQYVQTLPSGPDDEVWRDAPVHPAKLLLQDIVDPRLMTASTPRVDVQAITDGRRVIFRMQWDDTSESNLPGAARFSDACAVQLPAKTEADLPAPQMGEAGRIVEISYWSASMQAIVNGRKDEIQSLYPNAKPDHYPFEAPSLPKGSTEQRDMEKRYMPAKAALNPVSARNTAVQDLVAEGPGTLRAASQNISSGSGKRTDKGWVVMISRPLTANLRPGGRTQAAFAVWEGGKQEVGARKMRTAWIPLAVEKPQ